MNRAAALPLLIVLSPLALPGQSSASTPLLNEKPRLTAPANIFGINGDFAPPTFPARSTYHGISGAGCPVNLRAQRQAGDGSMKFVTGPQSGIAQRIHLTFANRQARSIIAARITVHGFTATPRFAPVDGHRPDPSEITRTIDLNLTVAGGANASTDLILHAFASVSQVDVDSLNYADGTSWISSSQQLCHIVPDIFMLISSR